LNAIKTRDGGEYVSFDINKDIAMNDGIKDSARKEQKKKKSNINDKKVILIQKMISLDRIMEVLEEYFKSKIRSNMLFK
jgi:hypothetical protein